MAPLFPLEYKPSFQGEDYWTQKGNYALHSLVFCDHLARIRHITVGWPGSVHDNRVWTQSSVHQSKEEHFNEKEYLLGDSAFKALSIMIPAFKKPFGGGLGVEESMFNTKLAKVRIKSEHCIGLLKARFQCLKRIRVVIKDNTSLRRANRLILATSVLHNLMIAELPPPNYEEVTEVALDEGDELNQPVAVNTDQRRQQIFSYVMEKS